MSPTASRIAPTYTFLRRDLSIRFSIRLSGGAGALYSTRLLERLEL